jgi:hypothetical protein
MPANHQAIIYKRDLLLCHPYPLKYGLSEDYWLSATLLKHQANCAMLNVPIASFEVGGISTLRFWKVCSSMAKIQRDILFLPYAKISLYYLRRFSTMSINYLMHKLLRNA